MFSSLGDRPWRWSEKLTRKNALFICSRNQWRSPTAESIFSKHPVFNVRSAGTSTKARRKVSEADLNWADIVFVMEARHARILKQKFGDLLQDLQVVNLDIPDEFQYMDDELVEMLEDGVGRELRGSGRL